jgi:hypothetical protein
LCIASDRARLLWRRVPEAEKERNVELRVRLRKLAERRLLLCFSDTLAALRWQ